MSRIRSRLNYANVVATLALFVALGGTATAAIVITGRNVKDGTLTGRDVKNSSLGTLDIKNGNLLAKDFKAGQLPAGSQGLKGDKGDKGDPGTPGVDGLAGAAGTARAYGAVRPNEPVLHANWTTDNVTGVERIGTGRYCVTVAGVDAATTAAVAGVEYLDTNGPEGNASVIWWRTPEAGCRGPGQFEFLTQRHSEMTVMNSAGNGGADVVGSAQWANDVAFSFIIP